MKKVCIIPVLVFCLLTKTFLYAQVPGTSAGTDRTAQENAIADYYQFTSDESHLFNGYEYVAAVYNESTNPLFKGSWLSSGELCYDGVVYHDVPLMYDITKDLVITNRFNMDYRFVLVSEKISYFKVLDHHFVRLSTDSLSKTKMANGFYDLLYDGRIQVYAKRQKKREENSRDFDLIVRVVEHDSYFISKGRDFYPVHTKKELFAIFRDRKSDIRRYLRKSSIKFSRDPELAIQKSAAYYDQFKN
jgi:hypothetical protein